MDGMKQWYLSKTVWGALIAAMASLLHVLDIEIDTAMQSGLADDIVTLAGAIGGIVAVYGRLAAHKRLGA
ncbi:MAG: hypothetical protein KDJ87_20045 [Rhizobiaceae bacterium]|nr:hypothetical protein [Rhizobiaceae bacterium]